MESMRYIDWPGLEDRLYTLCVEELRRFARSHRDETFYAFALDCNSEYGQILLCLNTPDALRQAAILYSTSPPNQEAFEAISRVMAEQFGEPYIPAPLKSVEENERDLCWSVGDWKYQGFNRSAFERAWGPFSTIVLESCFDEEEDETTFMTPTQDRFTRMACRVVVRMEIDGAFECLCKTEDFKTWVADHDELDETSWSRLESVRCEIVRSPRSQRPGS